MPKREDIKKVLHPVPSSMLPIAAGSAISAKLVSLVLLFLCAIGWAEGEAGDPAWCNQFRGPKRNGVYPATGLLQSWPAAGPPLQWESKGLGVGYSSPIVTPDGIFITGDREGKLMITALDQEGRIRWEQANGKAWTSSYPGARAACTYHRGRLFHLNAHGRLVCLDPKNGSEHWSAQLLERFGAPNIKWGLSECLLLQGDRVFAITGGPNCLMVALDARNGKLIWKSQPLRFLRRQKFGGGTMEPPQPDTDKAGYSSPVLLKVGDRELLAAGSSRHFFLVDAFDGSLLWQQEMPVRHEVIGAIPVVNGQEVLFSAPDCGSQLFRITSEEKEIKVRERWKIDTDNCHGAMTLVNDRLVGSGYRQNRDWVSVDWNSGRTLASLKKMPIGSAVWADQRFYALSQRGLLLLLELLPDAFVERGRMQFGDGRRANVWAHPVIHGGRLYQRLNGQLFCYDLRCGE